MKSAQSQAYVTLDELLSLRLSASRQWPRNLSRSSQQQSGPMRSRLRGNGIEFEELRAYAQGDDIRSIDWRLSARTGKPLTRVYSEDREQAVYLVVDQRSSLFFGARGAFKSVTAARMAAHLAWFAYHRRERLGGMIIGAELHRLKIRRSQQSLSTFLSELVAANTSLDVHSRSTVTLGDALVRSHKQLPAGARVYVISDFKDLDETVVAAVQSLGRQRQLQLVKVSDSLEDTLPVTGSVGISNGESIKKIALSGALRRDYLQRRQQHHNNLLNCATECRQPLLCVTETDSPDPASVAQNHGLA